MNRLQHLILPALAATVLLLGCNSNNSKVIAKKDKATTNNQPIEVPHFNSDSAYKYVAEQCAFGPRTPESSAAKACASFLSSTLERFADTVILQDFKARAYNDQVLNGQNIIGVFNPELKNRIFLSAHWDSRPYADHDKDPKNHNTPINGANDGASGVGVLLELARVMHEKAPNIGVDIVLFDLEDFGPPNDLQRENSEDFWGLGSQYWSANPHVYDYQAYFGILLDMVGDSDAKFPMEGVSLYYAPHVVKKVWNTAKKLGYDNYFIEERGGAITDDHYYVNTIAGIPTIDIIHLENDPDGGSFVNYWHTIGDDIDKIDKNTLGVVGKVITQVVYEEQ